MCEKSGVTSVEEGHEVESDVAEAAECHWLHDEASSCPCKVQQKTPKNVSSHTEMCKKGDVTSGEEGHDVERAVPLRGGVLDELDIGQPPAECRLVVLRSRRKLFTRRDELRPVKDGAEDTNERVMTSHTEMCEGCEVFSVVGGHDVERVTVRSDVVKETMSAMVKPGIGQPTSECLSRVRSTKRRLVTETSSDP